MNFKSKEMIISYATVAVLFSGVLFRGLSPAATLPTEADIASAAADLPSNPDQEKGDAPEAGYVVGNGVLEPFGREIRLSSSIGGIITEILVKEGQFVQQNELLVKIEDSRERAGVDIAEAEFNTARVELTRILRGLRKEDVQAILAEAQAAQSRSDLSAGTFARLSELADSGGVSVEVIDKAKQQFETDKANLQAAEARKRAALAGSRAEDVEVAQAKVRVAEANRTRALAELSKTEVRAPQKGEILQIKVRAGEFTTPGASELLVLGNTEKLTARVDIDERSIAKIELGAKGYVTLSAYPGKKFTGFVSEVGRRMGRKNVRSDDPIERIDTKILETVIELESKEGLYSGVRVLGFIQAKHGEN